MQACSVPLLVMQSLSPLPAPSAGRSDLVRSQGKHSSIRRLSSHVRFVNLRERGFLYPFAANSAVTDHCRHAEFSSGRHLLKSQLVLARSSNWPGVKVSCTAQVDFTSYAKSAFLWSPTGTYVRHSRSRCEARTGHQTQSSEESGKWDFLEGNDPISLPVVLLSVPLGLETGSWLTSELVSSYLWFKVVMKHVLPLFMTLHVLRHCSNLLELSLDSSRGRLVLWKKRRSPEARKRIYASDDMTYGKVAGYLPVSSSSSYPWFYPPKQLLLPAPISWHSWSGDAITAARLQLLVALESISTELDWYFSNIKSRMRAPDWWEDKGQTYGFSLLALIGMGYWVQGFRCFPWLAMNYYFKDGLQLDPVTLQILQNTVNLPYLAKPVYGIISDTVYIYGAHRVPYIIIAGIFQVVSWGTIVAIPGARKSTAILTAFLTFGNLGAALADVANDALVAETGKKGGRSGELQSFAWLASAAGGLLGNLLSGLALSGMDYQSMFTIFVLCLAVHLLIAFMVSEESFGTKTRDAPEHFADKMVVSNNLMKGMKLRNMTNLIKGSKTQVKAFRDQITKSKDQGDKAKSMDLHKQVSVLFGLVKTPEILLPLLWFMGSYAIVPTLSGSIFYYQSEALKINPFFLGLAKMLGQAGLLAGSLLYERYLKPVPLRTLVGCVQVLLSVCIIADIGLVNRINVQLGIPDQFYVLGASAFVEAIAQFKILPFLVFFSKLCPAGSEGSLLAFFMSCQCLACLVSGYLGAALASFLDISSSNFTHLGAGIFVQSLAALLPLLGIMLLPGELEPNSAEVKEVEKMS